MKFTAEAAEMKTALGRLDKVAPRGDTIPILNHLHVTAGADELVLRATDMCISLECRVAAQVEAPGAVAAPGAKLRAVAAGAASGAQITLTKENGGGALLARAGRARFRLPVLPPDDFPAEPAVVEGSQFALPGPDFLAAAARVASGMSREETRYYLNGTFLHIHGDSLCLVATDGHTLFRALLPLPEGLGPEGAGGGVLARDPARHGEGGVIVPRGAVHLLPACFAGCDELEVSVDSNLISVAVGGTRLTAKLIDGTFPDYERVIPKDEGSRAALPREAALAALARVVGFSGDRATRAVALRIGGGRLLLAVEGEAGALAVEGVDVAAGTESFETGINGSYLREVLASRPSKSVDLVWAPSDPMGPMRILDPDLPGEVAVIMPLRVNFPDSLVRALDDLGAAA